MYRVLCIEDAAEVQILLKRSLAPYFEIRLAANLADGRKELSSGSFDLLILDIGLPDGHISRIRKKLKDCDCMIEGVQNAGYRFSPVAVAKSAS